MVKRIEREFMDNIVDIFQKPKKLEAAAAAQEATITEENQTFSYGKLLWLTRYDASLLSWKQYYTYLPYDNFIFPI